MDPPLRLVKGPVRVETVQSTSINEALLDEGAKLLLMEIDNLYATLGIQLLGDLLLAKPPAL